VQAGGRLVEDEHDRSLCVLFSHKIQEYQAGLQMKPGCQ
jgi:hypothetical protein